WALGIVLYECLHGRRPTAADHVGKVLKIILTNAIPPIGQVMPGLPEDVKALIARMLTLDREGRPSDMLEVGHVLARYGHVQLLPFELPRARPLSEFPPSPGDGLPVTVRAPPGPIELNERTTERDPVGKGPVASAKAPSSLELSLDEPFDADPVPSDQRPTEGRSLTLGDLLSPAELDMLGEQLEQAQTDTPDA